MNPQRSTFEDTDTIDAKMRMTAFEQVQRLNDLHDGLTTNDLKAGFYYEGNRIPIGQSTERDIQTKENAIPAFN